jgi:hypothetical protein
MNVFYFSEVECFGTNPNSAAGEGYQYPIFTDNASRIKKTSNGTGSAYYWWERSPATDGALHWAFVQSNGTGTRGDSNGATGVCFGFCV